MFDARLARVFYVDWPGFDWAGTHQLFEDAPLYAFLHLGGHEVLHLSEHHGDSSPGAAAMIFVHGLLDWFDTIQARPFRFCKPALVAEPWGLVTQV